MVALARGGAFAPPDFCRSVNSIPDSIPVRGTPYYYLPSSPRPSFGSVRMSGQVTLGYGFVGELFTL